MLQIYNKTNLETEVAQKMRETERGWRKRWRAGQAEECPCIWEQFVVVEALSKEKAVVTYRHNECLAF